MNAPAIKQTRNIFDIEAELSQICEAFDQLEDAGEDPEILKSVESYVAKLLEEREGKVDAYTGLIKSFEARAKILRAEADTYREELDRLNGKAKTYENRIKRLKEWARLFMTAIGATRLEGKYSLLRIQANSAAALVVNEGTQACDVEERFIKRDLDEAAIRKALEAGEELPFAHLERGSHVRLGTP